MNNHITLDNLLLQLLNLFLVHRLNLVVPFQVRLLKVLELSLKLLKLTINSLVISRQRFVDVFEFLILSLVLLS